MSDDCGGGSDSKDCSGDVNGGYSNDYSYDTQISNYSSNNDYYFNTQIDNNQSTIENVSNDCSGLETTFSTLETAMKVVSTVESTKFESDNLNTSTRLQIDNDLSIDHSMEKSETIIWNNLTTDVIPSYGGRYVRESNYLYKSSVGSTNDVISNINNKNIYNRPRIEISENNTQSTWFCIIMVAVATFLILLMIACVVLANMPSGSAIEKTTIYSPVMSRPLPQGAHSPISKI